MKERVVEDFLRLVRIDSLSLQEKEMAKEVSGLFAELGIKLQEDEAADKLQGNCGNLYGIWEGEKDLPPVLLSAHLDTVAPGTGKKPCMDPDGGCIRSDGSTILGADDLAGIAEILDGIRRVKESGRRHRTVELLFPVAEEIYTKGAAVFDYSRIKSREAYCFDLSGDVGLAAVKAPTLISFRIIVKGKASHAGFAPGEGIHAIYTAAEAVSGLRLGQVDEESTVNIGTISGGCATNIVPDRCELAGEIRSFCHEKALAYLADIREKFKQAAVKNGAEAELTYEIHFKAYEVTEAEAVVTGFAEACRQIGLESRTQSTLGGADNHQFLSHGIRGIVVACGMENVHTRDEYIRTDNLINGAKLVQQLILA